MGCRRRSVAIAAADMAAALRPHLARHTNQVVFVDFDAAVPWREVIATMDRIRSIATDRQRDAVHVVRKVKPVDGVR